MEFLRHYTFDSGISQEVRGEGNELVGLVSVGIAAGWLVTWVVIGAIVIGEVFLLAMLGLRGSERREERD